MRALQRRAMLIALMASAGGCVQVPLKLAPPTLKQTAPLAGVPVDTAARWPAADWWKDFGDAQLDDLEARALQGAPTLATARSRYATALKVVDQAAAQGGFGADLNAQVQRQRLSENGFIPSRFLGFTWYNQGDLAAQFSYDFDFWGRRRDAIEAALDRARAAQAESNAAALLLTVGVADTYFAWQGDQARSALAREAIDAQQHNVRIIAARTRRGIEDPDDLHRADAALASAREQAAALRGSAQIRLATLAALLGIAPAQLPSLMPRRLPAIDDGLPADAGLDLVARRPDIAASRWRVEAATQDVKQARAAFFPDISLKGLAGFSSIKLDKLFDPSSRVFDLGAAIHLPLFDGGSLRAQYGVSRAQLDSAIADYNAVIVDAARDVAAQTLTLQTIDQRAHEQAAQVAAATRLRDSAAERVRAGVTDARPLVMAQTQWLQQRDAQAVLAAQRVSAEIALIKALGGGFRDAATTQSKTDSHSQVPQS